MCIHMICAFKLKQVPTFVNISRIYLEQFEHPEKLEEKLKKVN